MKLSKTQVAILRRLDSGDRLMLMKGGNAYYYWRNVGCPNPRSDSVHKLCAGGAIIRKPNDDWKSAEYAITNKGREYLQGLEQGSAKGAR